MTRQIRSFHAFFRRELDAGRANRSLFAFPLVLLAVGFSPVLSGSPTETAQLYLLQALLYLVPLFAIVSGTSAAQADSAENPLLGSLPVAKSIRVLGKFAALFLLFGGAQLALYIPSLIAGAEVQALFRLWAYGLGISAVFLSLGLLLGFRTDDGVRAHLLALGLWLAVTFGFGFVTWLLAAAGWAERYPGAWLLILGASPLEALRIGVLFSVEAVPFSTAAIARAGRLWLDHPGVWFSVVTLLWTSIALTFSRPRRS